MRRNSCSGVGSKPLDADFIMGRTQRGFTYYRQESVTKIAAVNINETLTKAIRLQIENAIVSELGEIAMDRVVLTADKKFLTVKGDTQIYEYVATTPQKVAIKESVLPTATLETLCLATPLNADAKLGNTDNTELRIYQTTGGYKIVKVSPSGVVPLLSEETLFSKVESVQDISFISGGVTSLSIKKQEPNAEDSAFYNSTWGSVLNIACHLNLSIKETATNTLVASQAYSATTIKPDFTYPAWQNTDNALTNDGAVATGAQSAPPGAGYLLMKGYFSQAAYVLPTTAVIDGIKVRCRWAGSMLGGLHIPDSEVYLAKAGTKVGTNKANGFLLPFTLAYSSYYGGATDLWGTTWTPAEINDSMFGAMIRFETEDSTVSVDNCELSVYWH